MTGPVVIPALRALDDEITSVAPKRTLPTWFLGDAAHRRESSGHNPDDTPGVTAELSDSDSTPEIRAGDFRLPLNAAFTPEQLVQLLVKLCRSGQITWIYYIIYNRRIWSSSHGWTTRAYTGSNPHDKHIHVSGKSDSASEKSTKRVGLAVLIKPKPTAPKPQPSSKPPAVPYHANGSRVNSKEKNNVGSDVALLQRFIGEKQCGPADGRFASRTEAGVKWYQRQRGLKADGIAGPKTWSPVLHAIR